MSKVLAPIVVAATTLVLNGCNHDHAPAVHHLPSLHLFQAATSGLHGRLICGYAMLRAETELR